MTHSADTRLLRARKSYGAVADPCFCGEHPPETRKPAERQGDGERGQRGRLLPRLAFSGSSLRAGRRHFPCLPFRAADALNQEDKQAHAFCGRCAWSRSSLRLPVYYHHGDRASKQPTGRGQRVVPNAPCSAPSECLGHSVCSPRTWRCGTPPECRWDFVGSPEVPHGRLRVGRRGSESRSASGLAGGSEAITIRLAEGVPS